MTSEGGKPFDFALLDRFGVRIGRLVADSRRVRPGDTFAAYPGEAADGRRFIAEAIAAGANAVLWEKGGFAWNPAWQVPNLGIAGLRARIGEIASHACGEPSRSMWMIGVTGTNGKTSCAHWLANALTALGKKTAVVGTLGNGFPGALAPSANTTPDAVTLHTLLKDYLAQGAAAVAMEVSSHGLAQGRVNGVRFNVALLTNLSRDHLDYHGNMASYAAAKAGLFAWPGLEYAVLNLDDPFGAELAEKLAGDNVKVVGYSLGDKELRCDFSVRGRNLKLGAAGISMEMECPQGRAVLESRLIGRFNAANLLGVLATLLAGGIRLDEAVKVLAGVEAPAGRLQRLGGGNKPVVVVDYAHTPDALEKVLLTLRETMPRFEAAAEKPKLFCVFGCGGQRDRGKRSLMGEAASRLADFVVVTSDNPRDENPAAIIEEIVAAMGANYHVIEDRAAAIDYAIAQARICDVVLIAGKGHEPYQEIKGVRLPFSDAEVAQRALRLNGGHRPC